jgi:hypothetical protein
MPSGANAFEISNIQEVETEVVVTRQPECNNVTSRRKPLNRFFADHNYGLGESRADGILAKTAASAVCVTVARKPSKILVSQS